MNLILSSGRRIDLRYLRQWKTYGGLLAGIPNKDMNDSIVERALETAAGLCKPFLIPPRITVGNRTRPCEPFTEERLPRIAAVGTFRSGELPGSGDAYSALTVVWFQDEFGPPVAEDVLAGIGQLDWESIAHETMWY